MIFPFLFLHQVPAPTLKQAIASASAVPPQTRLDSPGQQGRFTLPFAGLTAVAEKGVTPQSNNIAEADLGIVDTLKIHEADFTFTLRNTSAGPIIIDRLQPSCECTTAAVTINGEPVGKGRSLPPLPAGARASIRVHVDLAEQPAGSLLRFVAVYVKDRAQPAAMLQIRGDLTSRSHPQKPPAATRTFRARRAQLEVSEAGLSVAVAPGLTLSAPNRAFYQMGTVSALDAAEITHAFVLRNTGSRPLTVERFETSCHCTSAAFLTAAGSPTAVLPTLAPGQQASVRVTVRPEMLGPGPLDKSVRVFVRGQAAPAAVLEVAGTLRPSLSFAPALLDFGAVPAGQARALTVTATLDARLLPPGAMPALVASGPDLRVVRQPEILSKTSAPALTRTLTYRVTLLPSAPGGPLSGSPALMPPAATPPRLASLLASASVLVAGQVQADVTASPSALAFGAVPLGRATTRQVVLSGASAADISQIASASPFFTAHMNATTPVFRDGQLLPTSRVLEVTLAPQTPPGLLQTQIKVLLPHGQRLLIPVSAFLIPASGRP